MALDNSPTLGTALLADKGMLCVVIRAQVLCGSVFSYRITEMLGQGSKFSFSVVCSMSFEFD